MTGKLLKNKDDKYNKSIIKENKKQSKQKYININQKDEGMAD